jgi:hypothetical protein
MYRIQTARYFHDPFYKPQVKVGHDMSHDSQTARTSAESTATGAIRPSGSPEFRMEGVAHRADPTLRSVLPAGVGIPERYIARPEGDLQSDEENPGMFVDATRRRYLQIGGNWYSVRQDDGNGPWRVVFPDESGRPGSTPKPGIPVERGIDGAWGVRRAGVGLAGGMWNGDPARARDIDNAKSRLAEATRVHQSLKSEHERLAREIDDCLAAARGYDRHVSDAQRDLDEAQRRRDDATRARDTAERLVQNPAHATDDARHAFDRAKDDLRTAENAVRTAEYRRDQAKERLNDTMRRKDTRSTELATLQLRWEDAVRDMMSAQSDLDRLQTQ